MEKAPFYLTKRKLKSGKTVYYYYTYDENNSRTVPKSTGFSRKNDAFNFCLSLFQRGSVKQILSFDSFAKDWFTDKHDWTKDRQAVGKIAPSTLESYLFRLNHYILPHFSNIQLSKITLLDIKNLRFKLLEKYSSKTINGTMAILHIMLEYAVECGLLARNPMRSLVPLKEEEKREAFFIEEVKHLFSQRWKESDNDIKVACLLATITGMRVSEIAGLQNDQVFEGYINVDRQYYRKELRPPKRDLRFVPIPKRIENLLRDRFSTNPYVFWDKKNGTPMESDKIRYVLTKYYSKEMLERKKTNNLTFHSFRYFFNTYLVMNNINEDKVNFVIGHSSGKGSMKRLYTTWRPEMYDDVRQLQDKLLDELMVEDFLD